MPAMPDAWAHALLLSNCSLSVWWSRGPTGHMNAVCHQCLSYSSVRLAPHCLYNHLVMLRGGATAIRSSFVSQSVSHSVFYISFAAHAERWELKLATQVKLDIILLLNNYAKISYEALFSSYGVICLPCCHCWRSGLLWSQYCLQLSA